jgi:hypothetical protein
MNNVVCIDSIDHNEFKSRLIYGINFNEVVKESIDEIDYLIEKEKRIERGQHEITK